MSVTAGDVIFKMRAVGTGDVLSAFKDVGGSFAMLPTIAAAAGIAVGAAVIGIGVAAVHMAGDFQQGMTTLVTGAGEAQGNLKMVSDGILQMARDTGTSTAQLTAGMFMIESAGFHGAAGLNILKVAAEGAKVGNADLGVVADVTTTILKNYPGVLNGATGAVNTLIATVKSGKTHMEDLAGSLSAVLPTAANAGVGLRDVMGAMATMTAAGTPAADAATHLRQMIQSLASPSAGATKALKEIGLSAQQVSDDMRKSLPATLAEITHAIGVTFPAGSVAAAEAFKAIAGGSRQMQGMLQLSGPHLQEFIADSLKLGSAAAQGGSQVTGWATVQGDFNFKMSRAKEAVETLMISLGTKLLPVVGQVVDWFSTHLVPAIQYVIDHWGTVSKATNDFLAPLITVGGWVLTVGGWVKDKLGAAITWLTPYVKDAAAAVGQFGEAMSTRLGPAATNVGNLLGVIFGWIGERLQWLRTLWEAVWPAIADVLQGVWNVIVGIIKVAWALISGIFKVALDLIGGNWKQAWQDMKDMFGGIWDGIRQMLIGVLQELGGLVLAFFETVLGILAKIPGPVGDMARTALKGVQGVADQLRQLGADAGGAYAAGLASQQSIVADAAARLAGAAANGAGSAGIHHYAEGGVVPGPVGMPQLAIVHGGEVVTPAGEGLVTPLAPAGAGGGGGSVTLHVHVDMNGREMAQALVPDLMEPLHQQIRLATGYRGN